jgi:hypothetical protein
MKTINRKRCFAVPFVAVVLATMAFAGPANAVDERDKSATQVAKTWFTSLMGGDAAVTTSLSAVPFSFEGKEVKTLPELEALYKQVIEKRGKRNLKATSVKIESSSPEKVVVVLMIEGGDEGIMISVKPADAFRVVGFKD